uniref:Uncharacterized protein n=1 Tax=Pseudonaja textilis TaxID=8673 RepID=A0A670Z045_PSETE
MVLILPHILIAALRFFRRGQQVFPKAEEGRCFGKRINLFFLPQEALLSFGSVIETSSLREVIKDAIASVLPKVVSAGGTRGRVGLSFLQGPPVQVSQPQPGTDSPEYLKSTEVPTHLYFLQSSLVQFTLSWHPLCALVLLWLKLKF